MTDPEPFVDPWIKICRERRKDNDDSFSRTI
jgi:hypothetical protein